MNTILSHSYSGSFAAILLLLAMVSCNPHPHPDFIELKNGDLTATFTPYGARLVSLEVPDKNGKQVNVVWGFATEQAYRDCKTDPYYGAIIGRYGNRIAHGHFILNGKTCQLDTNDHGNTLHGGPDGFHSMIAVSLVKPEMAVHGLQVDKRLFNVNRGTLALIMLTLLLLSALYLKFW